mgnify:CR=1 FL=1
MSDKIIGFRKTVEPTDDAENCTYRLMRFLGPVQTK